MLLPITANYVPLRRSTPVRPMPRSPVRHFEPVFGVPLQPGDKRGESALNEHQTPGKRSAVNQHFNLHQNRWQPIFIAIYISTFGAASRPSPCPEGTSRESANASVERRKGGLRDPLPVQHWFAC